MPLLRIASGQRWNRYSYGTVTVSSEHSVLTKDRLGDTDPSRAFRAAAAVTDLVLTVDANDVVNGSFDAASGGSPTTWTPSLTGAGSTFTSEATIKQAGAAAAKLTTGNVGGAQAAATVTITARSGQQRMIEAYLRGDGASAAAKVRVQNLETGKWLQSDGSWSGSVGNALSRSANTGGTQGYGTQQTRPYTVESFAANGFKDTVSLLIMVINDTQNTSVYVDELYDYASFDCASLHGPVNIPAAGAVQLRSSPDGITYTTEATFPTPLTLPAAYVLLGAPVAKRFSQIKVVGTTALPVEIGEATTTQMTTPLRDYVTRQGGSVFRNLMSSTPGGKLRGHKSQKFRTRSRTLRFQYPSMAEYNDGRELFHERPEGDLYPALVIVDTSLPDVMLAHLGSTWSHTDTLPTLLEDIVVDITEMPFAPTAA